MSAPVPLAEELAEFVADFDIRSAPAAERLVERSKLHILDAVGLALAGWSAEDRVGEMLVDGLRIGEAGSCSIFGSLARATTETAALVNGTLATVWTFDDFDPATVMHCQAFAAATALALAERERRNGNDVVEAFVLATEVALRLASAVDGPRGLYDAGFHGTGVFGAIGSAAGAARLLGLDAAATADALSLAVSFASGTSAGWTQASGRNKVLHPGWAAHSGITAASLAAAGYSCSHETLDGERGMLDAYSGHDGFTRDRILERLGDRWRLEDLEIKLFPSGSGTQGAALSAEELFRVHGVRADAVQRGVITVPTHFAGIIRDLGESLYRPATGSGSIGSFPLVVARILMEGRYTLAHRADEAVRDLRLLEVADRFEVRADDGHLDIEKDARPTTVEVTTGDGVVVASHGPRGDGELDRRGIIDKFAANSAPLLGDEKAAELRDTILGLDQLADAGALVAAATRP